ncbi:hypothetical protein HA402_013351 [Bradysia odoriphaga]|nr:hypothetical protein HA402_013351 [Bradysia odoriphaga]
MASTLSLVFCLVLLSAVMASTQLDSALLESLSGGKTARLRVSMTSCPELQTTEGASIDVLTQDLTAQAARCQATVLNLLESAKSRLSVTWESLWPDQTIVNGADLKLANDIAALDNVAKIEGETFVNLL